LRNPLLLLLHHRMLSLIAAAVAANTAAIRYVYHHIAAAARCWNNHISFICFVSRQYTLQPAAACNAAAVRRSTHNCPPTHLLLLLPSHLPTRCTLLLLLQGRPGLIATLLHQPLPVLNY
jgi:hypothetical protein